MTTTTVEPPTAATRVHAVRAGFLNAVAAQQPLVLVEAPPGSGKTRLVTDGAALARHLDQRVAIAAQTNAQADDICRRLGREFPFPVVRFSSSGADPVDLGPSVSWVKKQTDLPTGPCIVVATAAKWGFTDLSGGAVFDLLLVDEAWQMAWADFMLAGRQTAARFVMVGDPGQISPVVTVDTSRWVTAPVPPQMAAPEVIKRTTTDHLALQMPVSRRLPPDSVEIVRGFYEFSFEAWARPEDRRFSAAAGSGHPADGAIDLLGSGSMTGLSVPTPKAGPPLEEDREVADLAAATAARLLERQAGVVIDDRRDGPLEPADIGISATHRVMNARIEQALAPSLRGHVRVDTPERWQGLERPVMICLHPLSGVTAPSAFDLETGRLCVMASRHEIGLIVIARDHVAATLDRFVPSAEQGPGEPDSVSLGHERHRFFWSTLVEQGRVVSAVAADAG
jgi:hypothetical protein